MQFLIIRIRRHIAWELVHLCMRFLFPKWKIEYSHDCELLQAWRDWLEDEKRRISGNK